MTVDEATIHAAIMAVNEALEKENSQETFQALSNPNTCLINLEEENAEKYQDALLYGKKEKASKCQQVRRSYVLYGVMGVMCAGLYRVMGVMCEGERVLMS